MILIHQTTGTTIDICYGYEKYKKVMRSKYGIADSLDSDGTCTILSKKDEPLSIVIGVRKVDNIHSLKGMLVHELNHAVTAIMDKYEFSCDEFRSYTLQWLYQETMSWLDNKLYVKEINDR